MYLVMADGIPMYHEVLPSNKVELKALKPAI